MNAIDIASDGSGFAKGAYTGLLTAGLPEFAKGAQPGLQA